MKQVIGLILLCLMASPAVAEENTNAEKSLERRQKAEFMSFFLKDPSEAKLPTASMGIQSFNQAVEYFKQGDYVLARQALEESLEQDDSNPFTYELLGDIDNQEQKLKSARENYQLAYNLNPTQGLKSKIDKLATQQKVESKLSTYRDQNFIIKYHRGQKEYEGYELRQLLRKIYRQVSKSFAYYLKSPIVVLLYEESDFKQITKQPHWVAGIYDGKVRMPIDTGGYDEKALQVLATHEVTHAFVAYMSAIGAPAWINEGLAEYQENKVEPVDLLIFNAAVKTNTLYSLDELMAGAGPRNIQDQIRIHLFYQQSFKLVEYLVDRYGMFRVKKILEEFGQNKNSDEAIRNVLKISVPRLEKEWLKSLGK